MAARPMPIDASVLRRLAAIDMPPAALREVISILADIQERQDERRAKDRERKRVQRHSTDIPRTFLGHSLDNTADKPRDPSPSPAPQRDNSNPLTPSPTVAALSCADAIPSIDLRQLENRLRSAAGLEQSPSPALLDLSPILGLIDAGFDLESEILPVVRSKAKPDVGSWNFFVKACHGSRASRHAAANSHGHASARAPPPQKMPEKRNLPFAIFEEMAQDERDRRGENSVFADPD